MARDIPLKGGGTAALTLCGKKDLYHFTGPRPSEDAKVPQMVVKSYSYLSNGTADPGRITIYLSIASASKRGLTLGSPLGAEGPSVEVRGPDGVQIAAYGLPVKIHSRYTDGQPLEVGPTAFLDFEVVVPSAAVCPGHTLSEVKEKSNRTGEASSTLAVTISDPAIARHRAALGIDSSSELLVATWPPQEPQRG
ncbi:hypothetical protein ACWD25_09830 [Streptomyces sp. NPDC002920]